MQNSYITIVANTTVLLDNTHQYYEWIISRSTNTPEIIWNKTILQLSADELNCDCILDMDWCPSDNTLNNWKNLPTN